jgi:hypothetical protein
MFEGGDSDDRCQARGGIPFNGKPKYSLQSGSLLLGRRHQMDAACHLVQRYIYHSLRKLMKHFNVCMEYMKVTASSAHIVPQISHTRPRDCPGYIT